MISFKSVNIVKTMVKIQPCCKASASETQVTVRVQMLEPGGGGVALNV